MENVYSKVIESLIVLIIFVVVRIVTQILINRTIKKKLVQETRSKVIKKTISFIIILVCLTILLVIWGVKQSDLAVFVGSVLTVIGVAMFAQWSILSNITASIVLFFNHGVKIGDTIAIMEGKEYEIQGKILDISLFFITLETLTTSEEITLPNNIFLQKTIRKVSTKEDSSN
jgi:small-conductance mechanosensitive channel